jgi:hypothetical protein
MTERMAHNLPCRTVRGHVVSAQKLKTLMPKQKRRVLNV